MNPQLDIFTARERRNKGILQAVTHADKVNTGWSEKAYGLIKEFLNVHVGPFQTEELRSYAALVDFTLPAHARAWGGPVAKAARAGLIRQIDTKPTKSPKSHCANAAVWIKS